MDLSKIPVTQLLDVAQNGSPILVRAAGRLMGFGDGEMAAAKAGKIPSWLWILGAVAVGFAAGARIDRTWPRALPEWAAGKRK